MEVGFKLDEGGERGAQTGARGRDENRRRVTLRNPHDTPYTRAVPSREITRKMS